MKKNVFMIFMYILATILAILFVFPLYWTLQTSFKSIKEAFFYPPSLFVWPNFKNYISYLSNKDIMQYLLNSIAITFFSTTISMLFGVLAAYSLTRAKLRGGESIAVFMLASRFIPPVSTIIPLYLIYRKTGLYDTHLGLIAIYTATSIPYVVWLMRGFLKDIPVEVEEAAFIEGCSRLKSIALVVLPMCKSGLSATAVLTLLNSWNEFLNAMMLTGFKAKTLPLSMITYIAETGPEWSMMATAGIVIILPTIIFSTFANKSLGAGMTSGAVKG